MSIAVGVTKMGRAQAEALIAASGCAGIVRRKTGVASTDPDTLEETPVWATIYTGPGKVRQPEAQPREARISGAVVVEQAGILSLPFSDSTSGDVRTDDVWEWTANPLDPSKVGQKLRIAGISSGTYMTARRFPVEETS